MESAWNIGITGGTGMIGSALDARLRVSGHHTRILSRTPGEGQIHWEPEKKELNPSDLEGLDAVVHLAGEAIAQRWTGSVREAIYRSRVESTRLLTQAFAAMDRPPKVLLSASGIHYYPSTELGAGLDEGASAGDSFLSRVCQHWEEQASKAAESGVRVCLLRTSAVLSSEGGMLARLLPIFRSGMGGRVGNGKQPLPWISLEDYLRVCEHLLFHSDISGAVNVVAPEVPSNAHFVEKLGEVLDKPARIPTPALAVRAAFGEMGKELILNGIDARPARLLEHGFTFEYPDLKDALGLALRKS